MSFETDFDSALTILLGKAQSVVSSPTPIPTPTPSATVTAYNVVFAFGGGGSALTTSADPILVEVPDSGDLVWVHLYAGNAAGAGLATNATLSLTHGSYGAVPGGGMNNGGSAPSMSAAPFASTNLSGWTTHVDAGDALRARITAISGGATWLSLIVRIRRDGS